MRLFRSFGLEEQSDLGPQFVKEANSFKADDKSLRVLL